MHTPNHHRPADTDPDRLALAVVMAGQRAILDRLRLMTGMVSALIIIVMVFGVVGILW